MHAPCETLLRARRQQMQLNGRAKPVAGVPSPRRVLQDQRRQRQIGQRCSHRGSIRTDDIQIDKHQRIGARSSACTCNPSSRVAGRQQHHGSTGTPAPGCCHRVCDPSFEPCLMILLPLGLTRSQGTGVVGQWCRPLRRRWRLASIRVLLRRRPARRWLCWILALRLGCRLRRKAVSIRQQGRRGFRQRYADRAPTPARQALAQRGNGSRRWRNVCGSCQHDGSALTTRCRSVDPPVDVLAFGDRLHLIKRQRLTKRVSRLVNQRQCRVALHWRRRRCLRWVVGFCSPGAVTEAGSGQRHSECSSDSSIRSMDRLHGPSVENADGCVECAASTPPHHRR